MRHSPGRIERDFRKNKSLYLMLAPVVLWYIIFCYWPMYGVSIAFKDFRLGIGILASPSVGFQNFVDFFTSVYCKRVILNTLILNVYAVLLTFPVPIVFALLLNEITSTTAKGVFQTFTYLPHFISTVVICGIIVDFTSSDGVVTGLARLLGYKANTGMLLNPRYFRPIYVLSDIWQDTGWNSIIYLSAISAINPELYEAARIDGAGRWRQAISITLPCMAPTIIIMFILAMGSMMSVGFEKVFLLQQPATYSTSDVIATFVYRKGIVEANFGYSAAVGLFNSVINFALLLTANTLSRRMNGESLF
jgi:putative aldouronate transport system permease protein